MAPPQPGTSFAARTLGSQPGDRFPPLVGSSRREPTIPAFVGFQATSVGLGASPSTLGRRLPSARQRSLQLLTQHPPRAGGGSTVTALAPRVSTWAAAVPTQPRTRSRLREADTRVPGGTGPGFPQSGAVLVLKAEFLSMNFPVLGQTSPKTADSRAIDMDPRWPPARQPNFPALPMGAGPGLGGLPLPRPLPSAPRCPRFTHLQHSRCSQPGPHRDGAGPEAVTPDGPHRP